MILTENIGFRPGILNYVDIARCRDKWGRDNGVDCNTQIQKCRVTFKNVPSLQSHCQWPPPPSGCLIWSWIARFVIYFLYGSTRAHARNHPSRITPLPCGTILREREVSRETIIFVQQQGKWEVKVNPFLVISSFEKFLITEVRIFLVNTNLFFFIVFKH